MIPLAVTAMMWPSCIATRRHSMEVRGLIAALVELQGDSTTTHRSLTSATTTMKLLLLMIKNVRRNLVRTILTAIGTMILVLVITGIWSVLEFLDNATAEKSSNIKGIVTERWQIPSQMPFSYARPLEDYAPASKSGAPSKDNVMTWQFYGGTTDPAKRTFDSVFFAIALEPSKIHTMMDELDSLPPAERQNLVAIADKMTQKRNGVVVGPGRLKLLKKQIGDSFKVTSFNYRGIDLEFEIVGTFPEGRYDLSAAMNRDYLNDSMDAWARKNGKPHPMARKTLNLVWFRFDDSNIFNEVADQIVNGPDFTEVPVKLETASSGIGNFLEAYRDLLWGMRWLLCPAILVTLSLVVANAISISVRERRQELAVMKVLGFVPRQILILVLGEALLLGILCGVVSSGGAYYLVNQVFGGIPFPIAFFGAFKISTHALWWGPTIGAATAFLGSVVPAWSARTVKVSEVFSKVA